MKKIAIPTNGTNVDDHFGHCSFYTIYTLDSENRIGKKELLPSPSGCGCKSDIAFILKDMGVDTMLAGNMGQGAVMKLSSAGLSVYRGYTGNTDDVLNRYLEGDMGNDQLCHEHRHHHDEGHSCHN